ncbi:hypothetical protein E4U32_000553 [Claviceps aff. humidiphila group G2b]|nr:hypothetical protein E4U32_000553 [Claviceps aff. humidiphila group G2b]
MSPPMIHHTVSPKQRHHLMHYLDLAANPLPLLVHTETRPPFSDDATNVFPNHLISRLKANAPSPVFLSCHTVPYHLGKCPATAPPNHAAKKGHEFLPACLPAERYDATEKYPFT